MDKRELISAIILAQENLNVAKDNYETLLTGKIANHNDSLTANELASLSEEILCQKLRAIQSEIYNQLVATKGLANERLMSEERKAIRDELSSRLK